MPLLETSGPAGRTRSALAARLGASAAARKYGILPMPSLEWNEEVARETAHLYERVKTVVPAVEWPFFAPYVKAINELKKRAQRRHPRAQLPDAGNLQLRRRFRRQLAAARARGDQGRGRHHRAMRRAFHGRDLEDPQSGQDRADPRLRAGCSLAASITGEDVRLLRERFPGVPVVTYVNTSADVKAESDICCTSSNAVQVVESLGADKRHLPAGRISRANMSRRRPR